MRNARRLTSAIIAAMTLLGATPPGATGQSRGSRASDEGTVKVQTQRGVRTVTIPITIRNRDRSGPPPEIQPIGVLQVREDGDDQRILSIRAIGTETPISIAVLIQDDVVPSISNEIRALKDFVVGLPKGSRVMVGYIRSGALEVRQRFTADLDRAAGSLRIPIGSASAAPYNPYVEIIEALRRFEAMPRGRRGVLVISDGLDISRGLDSSSPGQSVDLRRAIREAQRQGVAIYAFYSPSVTSSSLGDLRLIGNAQGSLQALADETGGRAFFQGTGVPVSFDSYLKELSGAFNRQIALTYLSTHPKKGYHRIEVTSGMDGVKIDHPAGYTR